MTLNVVNICSKALLRLGAGTISSLDDECAEAEIAANLYPVARDALLSSYPWSFATAQESLAQLADKPSAEYAYAFKLPADILRIVSAGLPHTGRGMNYRIHQDRLLANSPQVTLTYIFRPDGDVYPAFFMQALIAKLSADFCLPLTEDTARANYLYKVADEEAAKARLIDSQQGTVKALESFSLIEARR